MGFVGSLVGGILGSHAANHAADVESKAAKQAQDLEQQKLQNSLDFQNQVWQGTQTAEQPYQELGSTAAGNLQNRLAAGFQAPNPEDVANTPEYKFALEQGTRAIAQNAAATGNLFSGNTGAALENYGQGLASQQYEQAYNNALNTYMANVNPLMQATGLGLSSTGQLGQFGQSAAGNEGAWNLTSGQQQAQQINNAAAARASGIMGSANAWSNAIGGMAGSLGGMFGIG